MGLRTNFAPLIRESILGSDPDFVVILNFFRLRNCFRKKLKLIILLKDFGDK